MRYTNIVTSIIKYQEKILLLKRSNKVKTMKNVWSGVSGIIENDDESPLSRAKIEIFEEIGLVEKNIELLKSNPQIKIDSPQYKNHTWNIFPFMFKVETPEIKLEIDLGISTLFSLELVINLSINQFMPIMSEN